MREDHARIVDVIPSTLTLPLLLKHQRLQVSLPYTLPLPFPRCLLRFTSAACPPNW